MKAMGAAAVVGLGVAALLLGEPAAGAKEARSRLPDLAVAKLSRPRAAAAGDRIPVVVNVVNKGVMRAGRSFLGIYLAPTSRATKHPRGRDRLERIKVRPLGRRRQARLRLEVVLPGESAAGAYRLIACADDLHAIDESTQRNNCRAEPLRLRPFARNPILFVHGWTESADWWFKMIEWFESDGWPPLYLSKFTYDSSLSNRFTAEQQVKPHVEELLRATGTEKVDIIAHSMGSLSSRWYIKELGGESTVDDWVSLGGPNHGTLVAEICASETPCEEMLPWSTFLSELNAGDETPGPVDYGTWWSPCDEYIVPNTSVELDGATNTETVCMAHRKLLEDRTVYEQVRDFVEFE
jgi:triacylglycerol lipase